MLGVDNLPLLFIISLIATAIAAPLASSLVKSRHGLKRLFSLLSIIMFAFFVLFTTTRRSAGGTSSGPGLMVNAVFYVFLGIQSLSCSVSLWSVCSGVFSSQQAAFYYGRIAAGATAGQLIGSLASVVVSRFLMGRGGASILLLSSSLCLALAASISGHLSSEPPDTRYSKARELSIGSYFIDTIKSSLVSFQLIACTKFLSLNSASILLGSSISAMTYLIRTSLLTKIKSASDRGAYVGALNSISGLLIILLQIGATSSLLKSFGLLTTLSTGPVLSILGMASISAFPSPSVVAFVEVVRKVSGHALTRPSREVLFTVASDEERLGAKFIVDMLLQRIGDALAASLFEGLHVRLKLGVRSLSLCSLCLAVISLSVAQWLVLEYKMRLKKRESECKAVI